MKIMKVKKSKPKIGVDLDDTFIDFMLAFCAYRQAKYGEPFERHHFTTFHLHEIWGCSIEEAESRIQEFYEAEEHMQIPSVPGAVASLVLLARDYELHGITARPPHMAEITTALVALHAEELFTGLHFLGHHKKKGDFCAEIDVRLMIDDALHNAQSVGARGIPVIVLDRPWNQGLLPRNATRVMHWDEIPRLVPHLIK